MSFRVSSRILLAGSVAFFAACQEPRLSTEHKGFDPGGISDTSSLQELLAELDGADSIEPRGPASEEQATRGRALVFKGRLPDAVGTKLSAYFYCADCHGIEREQSSLADAGDPFAKLAFAIANDLPHLPGPSLAGVVNRDDYFQGEIGKKFGAPAEIAHSLNDAIQFCSTRVARGRSLDDTEMEAVLSYLWSLEWRVGDLGLRGADLAELKRRALNPDEHQRIIEDLRQLYPLSTDSKEGILPENPEVGLDVDNDPDVEVGESIWSRTCLHCHDAEGASEHYFGNKAATWKALQKGFHEGWLYGHLRKGTISENETTAHMPPFSKERLSDAQIESLRAYLESKAQSQKDEN